MFCSFHGMNSIIFVYYLFILPVFSICWDGTVPCLPPLYAISGSTPAYDSFCAHRESPAMFAVDHLFCSVSKELAIS